MFRSLYEIINDVKFNSQWELIDDDFTVVISPERHNQFYLVMVGKEYKRRGLNVAANICKFCLFYRNKSPITIMNDLADSKHNYHQESIREMHEFFAPYIEDIKKYLVLL